VPIVTVRLGIQAGSVLDPAGQPKLAAAVASQLTAGTDKYTSLQLREAAAELGGSVGASASDDYAVVSGTALAENATPLVVLMADVVLHPAFPENELAIYRSLATQGLTVQRQNPDFLAQEQLAKALYGPGHPYGTIAATQESIQSLSRDKLTDFHRSHYSPAGAILVVVGDIRPSDVFALAEKSFGSWQGTSAASSGAAYPTGSSAKKIYLVNRPNSVQSNIMIGNRSLRRDDPDYLPLSVANAILGGVSTSRLYRNVREKRGYAYDVHSSSSARALSGEFTEGAQTRTDVTADAIKEMLADAEQIRKEPVTPDELSDVRNYFKGRFVLQMTSQTGLADQLLNQQMYKLPADYISTYRDRIGAVTVADVQRVAQKYMRPSEAAIVVVGDAEKLRGPLSQVAAVEEVR
jgi:zinc protease